MVPTRLSERFRIGAYKLLSEPMTTIWGFANTKGRIFNISNQDMILAFEEILENWEKWVDMGLNKNSNNPDHTIYQFGEKYFSDGAHKTAANDQRRGFLHLISAVAYLSANEGDFDELASSKPLDKSCYEAALEQLRDLHEIEERARQSIEPKTGASEEVQAPKVAGLGRNQILYGAPGTGKSHKVDGLTQGSNVERTVFHPDMQNGDFFGCLKPLSVGDGKVAYQFAPGPFARVLRDAINAPQRHHFLVIEELNRAPAAAVFGELFQLLDRRSDGRSTYQIAFPNPESEAWMNSGDGPILRQLFIPSNLTILATMNSADHGVYPLDTAFRRRWEQEYLPLYGPEYPVGTITFADSSGFPRNIEWFSFVKCLNDWLTASLNVSEDRLLGQWFVKESELGGGMPAKILLYLWDDLLRHQGREIVFDTSQVKTYGQLDQAVKDNRTYFSRSFLSELEKIVFIASTDADNSEESAADDGILGDGMTGGSDVAKSAT